MNLAIGLTIKNNRSVRDLISVHHYIYVMMTRDGKIGRRFIFNYGKYSSDKNLKEYDLALVFKNADVAFKALALGGETGMTMAINNWDLKLVGNRDIFNFFALMIGVSMGMIKRKSYLGKE
jgi:hypothetical protein